MSDTEFEFRLGESSWRLDFGEITVDESIELGKLTGSKWPPLVRDFDERDALAVKAFFWLARKKSGEKVAFDGDAMNFTWSQFRVEMVAAESEEQNAGEAGPDPTEETSPTSRSRKH